MSLASRYFLFLLMSVSFVLQQSPVCFAATPSLPEVPSGPVLDLAQIISPDTEQQLTRLLLELKQKTGIQMVILTVTGLDGENIEAFSLQTAEKWKLGRSDKDNGILFTVAVMDHRYRFEVGYGLEAVLPDSLLGTVGRTNLVPYFKSKNYSQGITETTGIILNSLAAHYGIQLIGTGKFMPVQSEDDDTLATFLFFLVFIIFIVSQMMRSRKKKNSRRRGRKRITPVYLPGGWSGSGSFGGGSGGFGGIGGFGGGGASGGW